MPGLHAHDERLHVLLWLDCALIRWLHEILEFRELAGSEKGSGVPYRPAPLLLFAL